MKIKFLKDCNAPVPYAWQCGDGCCSEQRFDDDGSYMKDEEVDLDYYADRVIGDLKFNVDYIITEYP